MAKEMIDYASDNTDDLLIEGGDFVRAESTQAHQRVLFLSAKGEDKDNPTVGVGAADYIDDENGTQALIQETAKQFTDDGMNVQSIAVDANGEIISKANY